MWSCKCNVTYVFGFVWREDIKRRLPWVSGSVRNSRTMTTEAKELQIKEDFTFSMMVYAQKYRFKSVAQGCFLSKLKIHLDRCRKGKDLKRVKLFRRSFELKKAVKCRYLNHIWLDMKLYTATQVWFRHVNRLHPNVYKSDTAYYPLQHNTSRTAFNIIQSIYKHIQYDTIQWKNIQYNTIQYKAMHGNDVHIILTHTILRYTITIPCNTNYTIIQVNLHESMIVNYCV